MLGLHFTPACVLLLVCSLHFTLSLHFTPGPQSAVRSLRLTLTDYKIENDWGKYSYLPNCIRASRDEEK